MFPCSFGLSVKSFSPNESSTSLVPLATSPRMESTPLPLNPFFLSLRVYRRGSAGTLLHWDCSINRMSWDRRDVTGSLHYPLLRLFVFLGRDKYSIWLSNIVICSLFWSIPLVLSWPIFLSPSLVLYLCSHFLIVSLQWMRFCLDFHVDLRNSLYLMRNLFSFFFRISFTSYSSISLTTSGFVSSIVRTFP